MVVRGCGFVAVLWVQVSWVRLKVMPLSFDGDCMVNDWGVSWLLLPRISNGNAAELTDNFR